MCNTVKFLFQKQSIWFTTDARLSSIQRIKKVFKTDAYKWSLHVSCRFIPQCPQLLKNLNSPAEEVVWGFGISQKLQWGNHLISANSGGRDSNRELSMGIAQTLFLCGERWNRVHSQVPCTRCLCFGQDDCACVLQWMVLNLNLGGFIDKLNTVSASSFCG